MAALSIRIRLERADFSLHVEEELAFDGIAALFGPSGAGKTTLLRVVAGLEKSARGRVSFGDQVWQDDEENVFLPPHRRKVGYVFQDGRLFPHLTVENNLLFAHRRSGRPRATALSEVVGILELGDLLRRAPASLSAGEQQRVAIGRALLTGPSLVIMDEPLSALDVGRKAEIIPYIERLPAVFSVPVLYVTHNVEELARLASNMLLIDQGKIVAHGAVDELLERMDLWSVTGRFEAGTVLRARVQAHGNGMTSLSVSGTNLRIPAIDLPLGTLVRLRVQARDVALATQPPTGLSIRNVLAARIISIDFDHTAFAEVLLDLGGQHLRSRITQEAVKELGLKSGQTVHALIKSVAFDGRLLA